MTTAQGSRSVRVYWDDQLVLEARDRPGPLLSRMAPPPRPGEQPSLHPFLSGVAHLAEHEGILGDTLEGSHSFDEFLDALRAAGYRVVEDWPP